MGKISPAVLAFKEKYNIDSDELWEVRPGAWAVKHSAIERLVAENGIKFDRPAIVEVNTAEKLMVICVFGTMGERSEWSFGEASPANCKIAYPAAIAEKRAKDRVAIKLLNATGAAIYSEEESDDFKRPNPHVNRVADFHDNISEDIPPVDAQKMRVKDSRPAYAALLKEMQRIQDPIELYEWGQAKATEIHSLSGDWPNHFKGEYTKHKASITNGKAA